jgi:hypothetical protein
VELVQSAKNNAVHSDAMQVAVTDLVLGQCFLLFVCHSIGYEVRGVSSHMMCLTTTCLAAAVAPWCTARYAESLLDST